MVLRHPVKVTKYDTMLRDTLILCYIYQCALPVITIMALWQLQKLGTRCKVTHCGEGLQKSAQYYVTNLSPLSKLVSL